MRSEQSKCLLVKVDARSLMKARSGPETLRRGHEAGRDNCLLLHAERGRRTVT